MYNGKKVGVGILTCNRSEYFANCLHSMQLVKDDIDELIIVNDGDKIEFNTDIPHKYIHHHEHKCISYSKNEICTYLLHQGCDYIFVIEDDLQIISSECLRKYIDASIVTKIHHFNFGDYEDKRFNKINIANYKISDTVIATYSHVIAALSFFTRECLIENGLYDESYHNAMEHADHTYRISMNKHTTPFGNFADIYNASKYCILQGGKENKTSIFNDKSTTQLAINRFCEKYNTSAVAYLYKSKEETLSYLQQLLKNKEI